MKATTSLAALLGLGAAVAPAAAFTGNLRPAFSAASPSTHHRISRRASATSSVKMMAIDPVSVHSVSDYVNAIGSAGIDDAWLSHVIHGELLISGLLAEGCVKLLLWQCLLCVFCDEGE